MYIYNADLYCDDCGMAIKNELDAQGVENTGDSGDYPQYADAEYSETDCPGHCGSGADCINAETYDGRNVGAHLDQPLTSNGMDYIVEKFATDPNQLTLYWIERAGLESEAADALMIKTCKNIKGN